MLFHSFSLETFFGIEKSIINVSQRFFKNNNKDYLAQFKYKISDFHRTATTHIKRQLISSDNSYQATTHINLEKRQLISSDNSYQSKLMSENLFQIIQDIIREN